MVYQTSIR